MTPEQELAALRARALVAAAIRQDADVGFLEQFEQGEAA